MSRKARRIREHYEKRIDSSRPSYDVLDWGSPEAQEARFDVLLGALRQLPETACRPSLLDVGCGLTDLCSYLARSDLDVRYFGADLTFGILAEGRRRGSGRNTVQADVFAHAPFAARCFDVTFCSGVFNLRLGNNTDFALRGLDCLMRLAASQAVANFLHIRAERKYPHCHYFDPAVIHAHASRTARRVEVVEDYLENDFSVIMHV